MSISTKREQGRERILDAARTIFAEAGLEGASLRAIAARAGYTPAALYFHFDSREAIYAALLQASLLELRADVGAAAQGGPRQAFRAGALALFDFYAARPQDLALGLYLGPGSPAPRGLGAEIDPELNAALIDALAPIRTAAAGFCDDPDALLAQAFAQAVGLLVLAETRRLRLLSQAARGLMEAMLAALLEARP